MVPPSGAFLLFTPDAVVNLGGYLIAIVG